MRVLIPLLLLVLGCGSSEPAPSAAPAEPPPSAGTVADQLAADDRGEPDAPEPAADPVHEAVDQAAREAGLAKWLAGERPPVKPTHRFVEMHTHRMLGSPRIWTAEGDQRIDGAWALDDGRLDLRFKLLDGEKVTADTWVACIWPGESAVVRLICGIEKARKFGVAEYALAKDGATWTMTLTDDALAAKDDWPLVMTVKTL